MKYLLFVLGIFSILLFQHGLCVMPYCLNGQLACREVATPFAYTGDCIPNEKICDGIDDCTSGTNSITDEEFCGDATTITSCIEKGYRMCKNVVNTGDATDPDNGLCIHASKFCDGIKDCPDATDEIYCQSCNHLQYRCKNGQCIYRTQVCNKEPDCDDHSDENEDWCVAALVAAAGNCVDQPNTKLIPCLDVDTTTNAQTVPDCIPASAMCRGFPLLGCPAEAVSFGCIACAYENYFPCYDSSKCVTREKVCDGFNDCPDGSDEHAIGRCTSAAANACDSDTRICILTSSAECIPKEDLCRKSTYTVPCVENALPGLGNFENFRYCGPYHSTKSGNSLGLSTTTGSSCNVECDYCVDFGDGTNKCVCPDGKTHPFDPNVSPRDFIYTRCGDPCDISDCRDGALQCLGTDDDNRGCVCGPGYYASCPSSGEECAERNCEYDSDCGTPPDGEEFKCVFVNADDPTHSDKFCLCPPGYDMSRTISTETCTSITDCGADPDESHENCGVGYNGTTIIEYGVCDDAVCTCNIGYYKGSDGFCYPRNDTCENFDCGSAITVTSTGNIEATGVCNGTKSNFTCECCILTIDTTNKVQYANPIFPSGELDLTVCEEPCNLDICGRGAFACEGSINRYKCNCTTDYETRGDDHTKCYYKCPALTKIEIVQEICGNYSDACTVGLYENDENFCICETDSEMVNGKCQPECQTSLIDCCGIGAVGCEGSIVSPTCFCADGYEIDIGTQKCIEKRCSERAIDPCFNGTCLGGYWSWTCHCDAGFTFDERERVCKGCDYTQCGSGIVLGEFMYYASSCNYTKDDAPFIACNCKDGFECDERMLCKRAPCQDIQCNMRLDSLLPDVNNIGLSAFGVCYGDYFNFTCKCQHNFELVNFPLRDGTYQKLCAPVDCSKSKRSLCGDHGYCVGYLQNYQCICDVGYRQVNQLCEPANCHSSLACGVFGVTGCRFGEADKYGSFLDSKLICECDTFGYKVASNGSRCIEALCDETTAVEACGEGATGCTGTVLQPVCECDKEKHYYPSATFRQCESSCLHNEEVFKNCGTGNTCHGPFDDYTCICGAFGFTPNIDDKKRCDQMDCAMATDDLSALDVAIRVCGVGALSCFGSWAEPRCTCDINEGYVTSTTLRSCVKDSCQHNEKIYKNCRIADGNSCFGSLVDATCDCRAKGFKQNLDATACEEISCEDNIDGLTSEDIAVMACGKGALTCSGTVVNPFCICDIKNSYYPGALARSCSVGDCRANGKIQDACKMVGTTNTCQGPESDFICLCNAKGYENDPNDLTICKEIDCANTVSICGEGAVRCSGTVLNPVCECDSDTHVTALDGRLCIDKLEAGCALDESIRARCKMEDGNICQGSTSHFVCVCTANGFIENGATECVEIECNENNAIDVCGVGATGCTGTMRNPKCQCDATKNYLPTVNLLTCDKANCGTNSLILQRCGPGNSCVGTVDEYECLCQATGFARNPNDKTSCLEVACDNSVETAIDVCGAGALKCVGLIRAPTCICDYENGFITSNTGASCIAAECFHNPDASKQCGLGNSCSGTYKSFTCVCTAKGSESDISDASVCNRVYCSDSTNYVQICGEGATGCEGPIASPTCFCDASNFYVPSADGTSCEIGDCRMHPDSIKCGPGRPCKGTVASFQCICNAAGYEYVPGDLKQCKEIACTSENAVEVCGKGAMDCRGTVNHPQCLCDVKNNYVLLASTSKCVPANCENNRQALLSCGPGNACEGTVSSFQCVCKAKGFTNNPDDPMSCKEVMCSDVTDFTTVCGVGAVGCEGSTRSPKCLCDVEQSYVASEDGKSCVLADCEANQMAQESCGKGNKCKGTFKYFSCVCTAIGYGADPTDVTRCIKRQCNSNNAVDICGDGATGCSETVLAPVCECNTVGYMPAGDKHSCVPQPCRFNKAINCLDGNKCSGTYFASTCLCEAPHYLTDPDNPLTCIYAPCKFESCGGNARDGWFATSCEGNHIATQCHCKEGFAGTGTDLCTPLPCSANPLATCQDNGVCDGTFFSWTCKCDAPDYIQHPRDPKQCVEAPCNVVSCGRSVQDGVTYNHAMLCEGPEKSRKCKCSSGYIGMDTPYCKPLSCTDNPEADCSGKGTCKGTFFKWACVCNGPDYIQNPTNPKECIAAPCIKERCGKRYLPNNNVAIYYAYDCRDTTEDPKCMCKDEYEGTNSPYCSRVACSSDNAVEVCGKGATDCEGYKDEPVCKCDESRKYHANEDASRCILSNCENHPDFKYCGPGNKCKGTIDSFQCVCSADGWENDPNNVKACKEMECTENLAITACGTGALNCSGTFLQPKCICDTDNHFVSHPATRKCVEASCKNSKDFALRCGTENSCTGSIDSYICVCDSKGYIYDPHNPNDCKEVMCNDVSDYSAVCGAGAVGCMGSTRKPICECNTNSDFIASADGQSCIPATCSHNIEAANACGKENKCIGTFKDWTCVCEAFGYEPDENNLKTCKYRECNNGIAEKICGDGATDCRGKVLNPICECETTGYILSSDKHSCKPMDCRFNEELRCGPGNKCSGSYFSATCVCNGPMYMTDKTNPMNCIPAPCKVEECGKNEDHGLVHLFAETCTGPYINPTCDCKNGYKGTGTPYCMPKDCKENPMAYCGEGGECKGTFFNWECVCKGPKYIKDIFDSQSCIEAPCKLESCGHENKHGSVYYFANKCEGYHSDRKCDCKEGFEGNDTPFCKPKDCSENPAATCNGKGRCKGTYIDWICVCRQPMFMQDAVDPKMCIDAPCKVENCGRGLVKGFHVNFADSCDGTYNMPLCSCKKEFYRTGTNTCKVKYGSPSTNATEFCGKGATSVKGPLTKPICFCDESENYISTQDGHACILADCNSSDEAKNCGPNKCVGSSKSFQCICNAHGWESDPYDLKSCMEADCDDEMAIKVCGYGATGCKGKINRPLCECDLNDGYVLNRDGKCEPADCSSSMDIVRKCGYGNKCIGSVKSYICKCTSKGYVPMDDDPSGCLEIMCEDLQDPREVCGDGVIDCIGSVRAPKCICDDQNDYITSSDGKSCIAATCEHNVEMQRKCGKGNKCMGTYKSFTCICNAPGYEPHPTDKSQCVQKMCTDELAEEVCGDGATGCYNTILDPMCECKKAGYMMSGDKHSCQPMDCRFNKELNCGEGNSCKGTYFSAVCVCNGPAYEPDKDNPRACKEAACDRKGCGMVMHGSIPHFYASGCRGTYKRRQCICSEGYNGTDTPYCKPESCNDDNAMMCGGATGRCKGTVDNWSCVCDSPTYILDPTNSRMCTEAPCKVEQCGYGYINNMKQNFAISCEGTYSNPICHCRKKGFVFKDGLCIIDPECSKSPKGRLCSEHGECYGDFFHFECICQEPEFKLSESDIQVCEEAPCHLRQCGSTKDVTGKLFYHASKCYGSYISPSCDCKPGYYIDPNTTTCQPAHCSTVPNVCDGNGECEGDAFHYNCTCYEHYDNPYGNMKSCKEASCNTHDNVCDGHGTCMGTFTVFDCNCYPGYEQKRYENGIPTCVKARCVDHQCGGTALAPYGKCGRNNSFDNYTCECNRGYHHPMLPSNREIVTECGMKCDPLNCGGSGVKDCIGTLTSYICVCNDNYIHPNDSDGHPMKKYCKPKCSNEQCGGHKYYPYGNCTGTKTKYTCKCNPGYSHPLDKNILEPIITVCKESCGPSQCGVSYGIYHGDGGDDDDHDDDKDDDDDDNDKDDDGDGDDKDDDDDDNDKDDDGDGDDDDTGNGGRNNNKKEGPQFGNQDGRANGQGSDQGGNGGRDDNNDDNDVDDDRDNGSRKKVYHGVYHGKCYGSTVSFKCHCNKGFRLATDISNNTIHTRCIDINECEINKDNLCDENAVCVNTPGSFYCKCHKKYVGNGYRDGGCYKNGGWGKWKYSKCTATCGKGYSKKIRECLVPVPYRDKDTCKGDAVMDHIACNDFPCEDLCERKMCGCENAKYLSNIYLPMESDMHNMDDYREQMYQYQRRYYANYDKIDDDYDAEVDLNPWEHFDGETSFKYKDAKRLLTKFANLASRDICKDITAENPRESFERSMNRDMKTIDVGLEDLKRQKYELQVVIGCNENPLISHKLFSMFKDLMKHIVMIKFARDDMELERKHILRKMSICANSQEVDFDDMMDIFQNRH